MKNQVLQANREQAERLAELGMRLRDLRQQQNVSIEQIAGKTRIQPRLLRAIEQGNLQELPEPVYIQSFIRQYADAIGVNGKQFASEFPTTMGSLPTVRYSWRRLPGAQLRPIHLYLMYMLLIVAAVHGLSSFLTRSAQSPLTTLDMQKLQPIPTAIMGPANPLQMGSTGKKASQATGNATSQKPIRVGMMLTSQSWVRIVADGKMAFEGVLPEGTQRTWTATKRVVIRAGNAGGVMVAFNDGKAQPLGQAGAIEEMAFPPDAKVANLPNSAASISP